MRKIIAAVAAAAALAGCASTGSSAGAGRPVSVARDYPEDEAEPAITPSPAPSTTAPTVPPTVSPAPTLSTPPPAPGALAQIADEGTVTYSITPAPGQCHAADGSMLPDPRCTPGSVDPAVTQATIGSTICRPGWTSTIRPPASETSAAKFNVAYPAYSDPRADVSELDHLVPLELGGSNDITNLWPELGSIPNPKDSVENDLRADVCAGELTLAAAQLAIARDWMTAP